MSIELTVPEKHVYVPETHVALGSKACCRAMDRATDHPQTCFQHQIESESARNSDIQEYSVPSRDHYYLDCWTQPKNLARIIFITCPSPVTLPGYSYYSALAPSQWFVPPLALYLRSALQLQLTYKTKESAAISRRYFKPVLQSLVKLLYIMLTKHGFISTSANRLPMHSLGPALKTGYE